MLFDAVRKLSEPPSVSCLPGYTGGHAPTNAVNRQFESERFCLNSIRLLYVFLIELILNIVAFEVQRSKAV